MAIYSWPANIAKSNAGWVTAVVDWPGIMVVGADPQTSILSAAAALSNAVRERIRNRASIPLPSELKPDQLQIPIDGDATALLENYLEETHEKRLRRLSEIEQANREKRASFLSEWRVNMDTVERLRDRADQSASEFALAAVKTSYLLNGGALVAIPAILQIGHAGTISKPSLMAATISFVVGIIFSVVTNFLAYRSLFKAGEAHGYELNARATEVKLAYYPPENPSKDQAEIKDLRGKHETVLAQGRRLAEVGVGGFGLSVLAFLVGVGIIICAFWGHIDSP